MGKGLVLAGVAFLIVLIVVVILAVTQPWASSTTSTPPPTTTGRATTTTRAPAGPHRIVGNNGSVSCQSFCNGSWGRDRLASKFPGYIGAELAPGASNTANAADEGSCSCQMSSTAAWGTLA
jgi:hypothetical protein